MSNRFAIVFIVFSVGTLIVYFSACSYFSTTDMYSPAGDKVLTHADQPSDATGTDNLPGPTSPAVDPNAKIWTNEPADLSVVLDCPFDSAPSTCGLSDVYSSSHLESDPTAAVSPPGVLRSTLNANNSSGGMQLGWTSRQLLKEMYVGIIWRNSRDWSCLALADKMWFIRGPNTAGFFGLDCTPEDTSGAISFGHNSKNLDNSHTCAADLGLVCYPNVADVKIKFGNWTKLESYIKTSTTATSRDGIVRWWVNGILVGNYTNINYEQDGLNEWIWTETWAALEPRFQKNIDLSHYIDHVHISARAK